MWQIHVTCDVRFVISVLFFSPEFPLSVENSPNDLLFTLDVTSFGLVHVPMPRDAGFCSDDFLDDFFCFYDHFELKVNYCESQIQSENFSFFSRTLYMILKL